VKNGCAPYPLGAFREVVTFQRIARVTDGQGGWTETWGTIAGAPTRAIVRPMSGSEAFRFQRIDASAQLMVIVRYVAGLTPADRVLIRGLAHNIRDVRNIDFRNDWLEIAVTQGVAT